MRDGDAVAEGVFGFSRAFSPNSRHTKRTPERESNESANHQNRNQSIDDDTMTVGMNLFCSVTIDSTDTIH
jgi:hypothetical protein